MITESYLTKELIILVIVWMDIGQKLLIKFVNFAIIHAYYVVMVLLVQIVIKTQIIDGLTLITNVHVKMDSLIQI